MSANDLLRVRFSDTDAQHPIGPVELGDEELTAFQGGSITLGAICTVIATEFCGITSTGPATVDTCAPDTLTCCA